MTFAPNEGIFLVGLIVVAPLGGALAIPASKMGPKRYCLENTRPAAYSLLFWMM